MTAVEVQRGRIAGLVFVLVWLSCAWFGSWEWNPNTATRLYASVAMVEEGTARIDRYAHLSIDKAQFGAHSYSDKAPGMTLLAIPAVAAVGRATGVRMADLPPVFYDYLFEPQLRMRVRLAAATTAAVLTAIAAAVLFVMAAELAGSSAAGVFAAIGFALGTPMWGWSTTLFGHAPVAALLVIAMWAAWRGTDGGRASLPHAAVLGGVLGLACLIEYTAVLGGAPVAIWAAWRLRAAPRAGVVRAAGVAAVPALAMLGVLVAYNLFAFGTPFRLGYEGVVGFEGMQQGLFGLTYPKPWVLWEITLGTRRGMVWVAPVAVLGLVGLGLAWAAPATRAPATMALAGVAVMFAYNASYAYWDGGNSTGPRHAVPALAYLAIGLAPAYRAASAHAFGRVAAWALLGASVAMNLMIAAAEIASGGQGDDPLVTDVLHRFFGGVVRSVPNEWLGWTPMGGVALWATLAGGVFAAIVVQLRRAPA